MADPDNGNASTEDTEADELLHGPPGNHLNRLCNSQPDSNPEPTFLLTQHERSDQLDVETGTSCAELSGVKAYTNLIVLTIALTLNFTAFNSFQALQSSLNIAEGLGTTGLSVLYATMVLTSLFFAQLTLVRFSNKWIMVISSLSYTAFMATGFYPAWSTVIPASLLIGFGAAHLWPSQQNYLTDLATSYAAFKHKNVKQMVHLFTGIYFGIFYTSFIWGNIFASQVFRRETENITSALPFCGSEFCSFEPQAVDDIQLPNAAKINIYTCFCVGTSLLGALCLCFLSNLSTVTGCSKNVRTNILTVCVLMVKSRDQNLLIIPSLTAGITLSLMMGDFTAAFVSCPYGVQNVGLVVITFGVNMTLWTFTIGKVSKFTGLYMFICLSFLISLAVMVSLLLWQPSREGLPIVFVLAGLYGLASAGNEPLLIMLHSTLFKDSTTAALSSYRAMSSLGWAVSFGYSNWLCMRHKLYIVITMLSLSYLCLSVLFLRHRTMANVCRKLTCTSLKRTDERDDIDT
ncbi:protein unc-93 homolog A-like isoform X1 [Mya arenaria]|uniref:protein unc-93 homolog A-like isoform X1 n=1 Tax=Mya arenaria TaxID=6604 RepID=UPI0022E0E60C|nr:protein unc-93 homolog A-like isoform X1 [Mya arenaria]